MKSLTLFILLIAGISFHPQPVQAQSNTLTIDISNLKDLKGDVHVQVFNEHQDFPKSTSAYQTILKPNGKSKITATFPGIADGKYAVMIFQDSNGNGKFDRNFIGIPKEPYALSNNFHPKMSSPSFEQCKIAVGSGKTFFSLEMIN